MSLHQPAFDWRRPTFDSGVELEKADHVRLGAQLARVLEVLQRGGWWTVPQIAKETGDSETSVSAQARNLRKPKFGSYQVEWRSVDKRSEYRLNKGDADE